MKLTDKELIRQLRWRVKMLEQLLGPMPDCEKCGHNDYVKIVGPGAFGVEFRCTRHRGQCWAQSW